MSRSDSDRIVDIQNAAARLAEIVQQGRETFDGDWILRAAAERLIEIIGIAADGLSEDLRQRRPDLPLREAKDMRNLIAHEYHRVDPQLLWEAIARDVPELSDSLGDEMSPHASPYHPEQNAPSQPALRQHAEAEGSAHSRHAQQSRSTSKRPEIVKALRRGGRTYASIARQLGVSPSWVSQVAAEERGKRGRGRGR